MQDNYYLSTEEVLEAIRMMVELGKEITSTSLVKEFLQKSTATNVSNHLRRLTNTGVIVQEPIPGATRGSRKPLYRYKIASKETTPIAKEPEKPAEDLLKTMSRRLTIIDVKLDSLCERQTTIDKIPGLYTKIAEVNANLENVTWRTGIKNREQLINIKEKQMQIAEAMLDFCETMGDKINKLANLVFLLKEDSK